MSARNLTSGFAAALLAGHVRAFALVDIGWTSGAQYLCGLDFAVSSGGNTYQPTLGLLNIETVRETADSFEGLKIDLAGVSSSSLAIALAERMQGRPLMLRMAVLDATNTLQVDANCWSGLLDSPLIVDGRDGAKVTLNVEHRLARWDKPMTKRYTHAQLQADFPGDLGAEYIGQTEQMVVTWPQAEFFRRP